ncbi:MAG: FHA domain-containing protein, partial [Planctomycetota bacterium]
MSIWLIMRTADGTERPFPLAKPRTVIGRDTRCDVRIALPAVDDRHCELIHDGKNLTLNDLGSTTGTFHNGARVEQAVVAP